MIRLPRAAHFATLPLPWQEDLRMRIRGLLAARTGHKLVVLDDDPTGTQCVHDIPVLTVWDVESFRREIAEPGSCFFVLTNSRSLPPDAATGLMTTIARNLREAVWRNAGFDAMPSNSLELC